jgi:hypothetical protein
MRRVIANRTPRSCQATIVLHLLDEEMELKQSVDRLVERKAA